MPYVVVGTVVLAFVSVGILAGWVFGSQPRRLMQSFGVVALVLVAGVVAIIVTSPTEAPQDCSDCAEEFGRWFNPLWYFIAFACGLLFGAGAIAGMLVRSASGRLRG